ncbi:MAG: potassium channel family protein [Flavobacteriales bacterium]
MKRIRSLLLGHTESIHRPRPAIRYQVYTVLRIWRNYRHDDIGLERLIRLFLAGSQFLSPGLYVKALFGRWGAQIRKLATEGYVLLKLCFPLVIFRLDLQGEWWAAAITAYMLVETTLYLGTLVFLQDVSYDFLTPKRSLALLLVNFFEIVFEFGLLYAYLSSSDPDMFNRPMAQAHDAIYFSFVTGATLGYGDIIPIAPAARELVMVQITLTFVFVGLFVNYFASMLQKFSPVNVHARSTRKTRHRKRR